MHIHRIEAENFGPYSELKIDFDSSGPGLTYVWGFNHDEGTDSANAIGKSMIFDAVAVALYGKSLEGKTLRRLVNRYNGQPAKLAVWVDNLVIRRTLNLSKANKFEVREVSADGKEGHDISKGFENIEERLGLNFQSFQFVYRVGGGESGVVSYAAAGAEFTRKIQDTLIQADRLTRCLAEARETHKDLQKEEEAKAQLLAREQKALEDAAKFCKDLAARHAAENDRINAELVPLKAFVDAWSGVDFEHFRTVATQFSSAKAEKVSATNEKAFLDEQISSTESARAKHAENHKAAMEKLHAMAPPPDIREADAQKEEVQGRAAKLRSLVDQASRVGQERANYQSERAAEELAKRKASEQLAHHTRLLADVDNTADPRLYYDTVAKRVETASDNLKGCQQEVDKIKAEIDALGDPDGLVLVIRAELDSVASRIAHTQKQKNLADVQVSDLMNLKPGTKCPVCQSDICAESVAGPIDHAKREAARLQTELAQAVDQETACNKRMAAAKDVAGRKRNLETSLKSARACLAEFESAMSQAQAALKVSEKSCQDYQAKQNEAASSRAMVSQLETTVAGHASRIKKIEASLEAIGPDPQHLAGELDAVQKEVELAVAKVERLRVAIEAYRQESEETKAKLSSIKDSIAVCDATLTDLYAKSDGVDSRLLEINKTISSLLYDDGREPYTIEFLAQKEEQLASAVAKTEALLDRKKSNPLEGPLKEAYARQEEHETTIASLAKEMDDLVAKKPYLEWWVKAFGSDGIRSMVLKEIVPMLNEQVALHLESLGNFGLSLSFDETLGLVINAIDDGRDLDWSECSGGQKKRVNLAVTMAFRDTIRLASDCDINLLMVDEASEALDSPGMRNLAEAMSAVAEDHTVWVITHSPVLSQALTDRGAAEVVVDYENRQSRVRTS